MYAQGYLGFQLIGANLNAQGMIIYNVIRPLLGADDVSGDVIVASPSDA